MERKTDRETEVGVLLNNGERERQRERDRCGGIIK